ncbi:MAG: hypothetical protein LBN93_01005 [Candidatus Symbiothrix sp.]|jgi:hypothetical protein|nr:hypothetical protein [Candidatus Symbiothrix sp.]
MKSKFFTFITPYLSFIDNGSLYRKPFSWLYEVIAVLNLLLPFYVLYKAIDTGIFDSPAKFIIAFLLIWVVIAFVSWISFQIWWDRKDKVLESSRERSEFVATPVFSHFIQTAGEWIGTWVGVVGFSVALLITIFLGDEAYLLGGLGIPFLNGGLMAIITMPIFGFLIIVISRFFAEQIRALTSIANNTKRD